VGISRRDFMKLFGIGVASLLMTRCRAVAPVVTCYVATKINTDLLSSHERLREYWLSFGDLAQRTREEASNGNYESDFIQQLITSHRNALDELIATGELNAPVADLIHEAYMAAIYHVWNSNLLLTCYTPTPIGTVNYTLPSADMLVEQANILEELSMQSTIDPETLVKVQVSLEHDLAYYDLSEADMQKLYDQIRNLQQQGQQAPEFEELPIEVTPEAKDAAHFIIDLLTGK
jgi:hypothetical protein